MRKLCVSVSDTVCVRQRKEKKKEVSPTSSCRDRFRTSINVLGDAYGAAIVYRLSRADLQRIDAAEARRRLVTISREQTISSSSQTTTQLPLLSHKEPVLNPPERPPESPTGSPPESSYEKRLSTALS